MGIAMRITKTRVGTGVALAAILAAVGGNLTAVASDSDGRSGWPFWGGGLDNTRNAAAETKLSPQTVAQLRVKWVYTAAGNVSATPTVDNTGVYVTDWGGRIAKLDRDTGQEIWAHMLSEYTGNTITGVGRSFSRNSPALSDSLAVFGDMASATLIAVDKYTGALVWKTVLDTKRLVRITASPTIYRNHVFVGVSSLQEFGLPPPLMQPDFRGSVASLDLNTGAIEWQFYTAPEGYSGNAVWGSSPVPDPRRGSLYITSGDNYTVPDTVRTCLDANGAWSGLSREAQLACMEPDNYVDSVIALDMKTGTLKWADRLQGADFWNLSCFLGPNWPGGSAPCGPDYDFGSGANLVRTVNAYGRPLEYVGAGQKSGVYWALDPDDGHVIWQIQPGPGGLEGGILWGSATDGKQIYVAICDLEERPYELAPLYEQVHRGGSWAALDASTGDIRWQIPEYGHNPLSPKANATSSASLTVANGVLYAGSQSGDMLAIDAASGKILWNFASGGTVMGGPSIVDGTVYWGSGYNFLVITGTPNNKLYAFALP
jgi:polyvinyl alcohol dehydrogenase (cytochrome)